jgi:putative oxidoreductase
MGNIAKLIGRILMSAIFIQAGISEAMNFSGTLGYFESVGVLFPSIAIWVVLALEIFGGLAILTGFMTPVAATLLGLFCIGTAYIGHSNFGDLMHFQAFMKDIAIAGGLFFMAAGGAGAYSLDARRNA